MRPRGYPIPFCPLISRYDAHAHRPKRKHDALENTQLPVMKRRVSSGSDYDHKVEERDEERYKSLESRHKSKISAQFRRQDDRMPISPHPPLPVSPWPLLPPPPYLSSQVATPQRSLTDPGHCMSTPLSAPMYHRGTKRTREPHLSPPSQTPPWRSLSFEHTHIPEDLFRAPPSPLKWETRNTFDKSRRNSYNSPRRISLEDSIDFPRIPFNPPLPPLPPPPPPPPPPPHAMSPKPRRHSDTYMYSGASRNEFKTPQRWRDRPKDKNTIYTSEEPRRRNEEWYSSKEREQRRSTDYKNYNDEWMNNKRRKRW